MTIFFFIAELNMFNIEMYWIRAIIFDEHYVGKYMLQKIYHKGNILIYYIEKHIQLY